MNDPMLNLLQTQAVERWVERAAHLPTFAVGDTARVLRREGYLSDAHIGDVGTVVEVQTKVRSQIVHSNAVFCMYTLRFTDGDTWSFADADLQPADASYSPPKRKGRKR